MGALIAGRCLLPLPRLLERTLPGRPICLSTSTKTADFRGIPYCASQKAPVAEAVVLAQPPAALVAAVAVYVAVLVAVAVASAAALAVSVVEFVFPVTSSAANVLACFAVRAALDLICVLGTDEVRVNLQIEVAGAVGAAGQTVACVHSVFLHPTGIFHKAHAQQSVAFAHRRSMR